SVFHLAWALMLARISSRHDVVFGTVLFGRMQGGTDTHRALGLYINTLPLRLSLVGKTAVAALQETHERLGELLRYEHTSLMEVQRYSALPGGMPLFSAVFNYRYDSRNVSGPVDGNVELMPGVRLLLAEERTNYPLGLCVDDLTTGFNLTAQAVAGIGSDRACRFMVAAVESLASALEKTPDVDVRTLRVIPKRDTQILFSRWAGKEYLGSRKTVIELFEAQAARTPDALAAICEERSLCAERSLSYGELD